MNAWTRSRIHRTHALIAPDSHVSAALAGWNRTGGVVLISPRMGAGFTQFLATMEPGGLSGPPHPGVERFAFVLEGSVEVVVGGERVTLGRGGYVFVPPDVEHLLETGSGARLVVFERVHARGTDLPAPVWGHEQEVQAVAFMGDERVRLKALLPEDPAYDWAVNILEFDPGASLPLVEVHVMEHGLLLLQGEGIYRLDDAWYPVRAGDAIWMAPYCPQWFGALGREPARYLYCKDVNRDPLARPG